MDPSDIHFDIWLYLRRHQKQIIIAFLLAIFCVFGFTLSLQAVDTKSVGAGSVFYEDGMNRLQCLLYDIYMSMPNDRLHGVFYALGVAAILFLAMQVKKNKRADVFALVFSCIFALVQTIIAMLLASSNGALPIFNTLMKCLLKGSAYTIAGCAVLRLVVSVMDHVLKTPAANGYGAFSLRKYVKCTGIVMLCWLPWFLIFFPGTTFWDTSEQILQFLGYTTFTSQFTQGLSQGWTMTAHHPVLSTYLYGGLTSLGMTVGNLPLVYAGYSILKLAMFSLVLTGGAFYIRYRGVSHRIFRVMIAFIALFPLYPLTAILMAKDSFFSLAMVALALLLMEVVRTNGNALFRWKFSSALFATSMAVIFTKNQGVYILAIIGFVFLIAFRKQWVQVIATMGVSILLYQVVFIGTIVPSLGIAPGGRQEALSVPFQQTARVAKYYDSEVTESEKEIIRRVLRYDQLADLYNPALSDPVKRTFDQHATTQDLLDYFKVWGAQLLRFPLTYIAATSYNVMGFADINHNSGLGYYYTTYPDFVASHPEIFTVKHSPFTQGAREIAKNLLYSWQHLPMLGLAVSVGSYSWILFFCIGMLIYQRRSKEVLGISPTLLSCLILIVSPDNGNYRYTMPLMLMLPLMIGILFVHDRHILQSLHPQKQQE